MPRRNARAPQILTADKVRRLLRKVEPGNHPDAAAPGLSLRIRKAGTASWAFAYRANGKQHRVSLGPITAEADFGLDASRDVARSWARKIADDKRAAQEAVALGEAPVPVFSPAAARILGGNTPAPATVGDVLDEYLREMCPEPTPGASPAEITRVNRNNQSRRYLARLLIDTQPSWRDLAMADLESVTVQTIRARRARLAAQGVGRVSINRGTQYASSFVSWAIQNNRGIERNPFAGFKPEKAAREVSRDVVPTPDELVAFWRVLPSLPVDYSRIWQLCALTGCRKNEIATLKATDVRDGWLAIGDAKTEAGNRAVPLSPAARVIIDDAMRDKGLRGAYLFATPSEGEKPFSNWSRNLRKHRELAGVSRQITLHDLRRLAFTRLAALGVRLEVIRVLLGHKVGDAKTQTYLRHSYRDEMQDAVDKLQNSLQEQ